MGEGGLKVPEAAGAQPVVKMRRRQAGFGSIRTHLIEATRGRGVPRYRLLAPAQLHGRRKRVPVSQLMLTVDAFRQACIVFRHRGERNASPAGLPFLQGTCSDELTHHDGCNRGEHGDAECRQGVLALSHGKAGDHACTDTGNGELGHGRGSCVHSRVGTETLKN